MKTILTFLTALLFPLAAFGQGIKAGPGTTNAPAPWTNIVRRVIGENDAGTTLAISNVTAVGTVTTAELQVSGGLGLGGGAFDQTLLNPDGSGSFAAANITWDALGNLNAASFTGARIEGVLTNGIRAAATDASLTKILIHSDTGDPTTNRMSFVMTLGLQTNSFDTLYGTFDGGFSYGLNRPDDPDYNPLLGTLGYGFEGHYVGSQQAGTTMFDMEHYLNAAANQTNSFDRPFACLFRSDLTNGAYHYSQADWNFDSMNWYCRSSATDTNHITGIGAWLNLDSRAQTMNFGNGGFITFIGENRTNATMIKNAAGGTTLSTVQFGLDAFGSPTSLPNVPSSVSTWLMPGGSAVANDQYLLIGGETNLVGAVLKYDRTLDDLQVSTGRGNPTNRIYRSMGTLGLNQFTILPCVVGGTAGDTTELGYVINSSNPSGGLCDAVVEFSLMAANGNSARYVVTLNAQDAVSTSWTECLPVMTTSNYFGNVVLDHKGGSGSTNRFRLRQISTTQWFGTVTISVHADPASFAWHFTTTTASGGTVAGYNRNATMTQINGRVGIGTNDPQATLDVYGTTHFTEAATFNNTVTASNGVFGAYGNLLMGTGTVIHAAAALSFTNYNYSKVFGGIGLGETNASLVVTNAGDYRISFGSLIGGANGETVQLNLLTNGVVCSLLNIGFTASATQTTEMGFKELVLTLPALCRVSLNPTNLANTTTTVQNITLNVKGAN